MKTPVLSFKPAISAERLAAIKDMVYKVIIVFCNMGGGHT